MGRLAQTEGLTDVQSEILAAVHDFAEKEIVPHAQALELLRTRVRVITVAMRRARRGRDGCRRAYRRPRWRRCEASAWRLA